MQRRAGTPRIDMLAVDELAHLPSEQNTSSVLVTFFQHVFQVRKRVASVQSPEWET